jgi:hypothetical protein
MGPRARKLLLSIHLAVSVGWIGAAAAYFALDLTTAISDDPAILRASYLGMDRIARTVIVPLALAALVTGIAVSLGTRWGLFRHYWVVISLLLTALATTVLLLETSTISALAETASDPGTTSEELSGLNSTLPHSIGGLLVLLAVLVLNMYKPRGLTRYGWRKLSIDRVGADQGLLP